MAMWPGGASKAERKVDGNGGRFEAQDDVLELDDDIVTSRLGIPGHTKMVNSPPSGPRSQEFCSRHCHHRPADPDGHRSLIAIKGTHYFWTTVKSRLGMVMAWALESGNRHCQA